MDQIDHPAEPGPDQAPLRGGALVKRHRLSTRLWHWTNAVTLLVMLMSGLMIFNAHGRLYWGEYGANSDAPWLRIGSARIGAREYGYLQVSGMRIETTGVLGYWHDPDGTPHRRAFPWWATIPSSYSLAAARTWHLAFAWVLSLGLAAYLAWSLANRHLRRDIHVTRAEWRLRHLWQEAKDHARLRFPTGAAALRYNSLQKISYAAVLFLLLPLMILTGLAMSPATDAWAPVVTELFGGRQSARSVHFLCAFALVGFVLVHVAMVVLAGPVNELRAMVDGLVSAAEGARIVSRIILSRRRLIGSGMAGAGGLLLAGCDRLTRNADVLDALAGAEDLHRASQRALGRNALAREFSAAQMSPEFRANGSREVADPAYRAHLAQGFAQWSLRLDGLVAHPLALPLVALRQLPQRTQITRHDCVEGWSAIGQWTGPRLATLLDLAKLQPEARYLVFHCADLYAGRPYYESIDLVDAFHPQTILAWAMNGRPLEERHGAPLRLRVERQLGYKHAKFVTRIEAVASLAGIHGGKGGYWEDNGGYAWYAGI